MNEEAKAQWGGGGAVAPKEKNINYQYDLILGWSVPLHPSTKLSRNKLGNLLDGRGRVR